MKMCKDDVLMEFCQQNGMIDDNGNVKMNDKTGLFYTKYDIVDAYRKSHDVQRKSIFASIDRLNLNLVDNRWVRRCHESRT